MLYSLIWEFMLYEFELGYDTMEVKKDISWVKGESTADHSTETRWLKKFCSSCKNLDDHSKSGRLKNVDSEAMIQTIETNLTSRTEFGWLVGWLFGWVFMAYQPEVVQREYQASLVSNCLVWFTTFTILAKASRAAELCFTSLRYWKSLNSPKYFPFKNGVVFSTDLRSVYNFKEIINMYEIVRTNEPIFVLAVLFFTICHVLKKKALLFSLKKKTTNDW